MNWTSYINELEKIAKAPKELEAGDILLVSGVPASPQELKDTPLTERVFRALVFDRASPATQGMFNHAAMYMGDGRVIESLEKGPVIRKYDRAVRGKSYAVYRPKAPKAKRKKAVSEMKRMIGTPYNAYDTALGGLSLLVPEAVSKAVTKVLPTSKESYNCSGAIAESYRRAGAPLRLLNPPSFSPPVDLANATNVTLIGKKIKARDRKRAYQQRLYGRAGKKARTAILPKRPKRDGKKGSRT